MTAPQMEHAKFFKKMSNPAKDGQLKGAGPLKGYPLSAA